MPQPETDLDPLLLQTATTHLRSLAGLIAAADVDNRVSARSRMLCCGLACLARSCYAALGGGRRVEAVGEAAAMLSLLTKIDDEVIDSLEFHGGPLASDRSGLDRRTRAFLAPTLASIRAATPANKEPRCELAARLGASLRELSCTRDRLEHLLDTIAFGWEVQVRAVRLLSSDPREVDPAAIEAVTADISGAWLLMITMVGELPEDATRPIDAREEAAFYEFGLHIQSVDALADLHKDTADGLVSSRPGVLLAARAPTLWHDAFTTGELMPLYRGMLEAEIDLAMRPSAGQLDTLESALAGLGLVPAWLRWIHGFLGWRWLVHPLCTRSHADVTEQLGRSLGRGWAGGWALQQIDATIERREATTCSAR